MRYEIICNFKFSFYCIYMYNSILLPIYMTVLSLFHLTSVKYFSLGTLCFHMFLATFSFCLRLNFSCSIKAGRKACGEVPAFFHSILPRKKMTNTRINSFFFNFVKGIIVNKSVCNDISLFKHDIVWHLFYFPRLFSRVISTVRKLNEVFWSSYYWNFS